MAIQKIEIGDCREVIKKYPDNFFDTLVTSPPYWQKRCYGTEPLIWDEKPDCNHIWMDRLKINKHKANETNPGLVGYWKDVGQSIQNIGCFCSLCGAWKGELGSESEPEMFVRHLCDIFSIISPKIKDTGSLWINLGDTYSSSGANNQPTHTQFGKPTNPGRQTIGHKVVNLPSKCLCLIPERFAIKMVENGFILRNINIWEKPNHMPESVNDRLTSSYEMVYHFVKQQKYYFDLDAVRIPHKYSEKGWQHEEYSGKFDDIIDAESFGSPRARTQRNKDANTCINNKEPYKQNNPHTMRLKGVEYNGKWKDDQEYMNSIQQRINEARASGVPHDFALNHPKGKNPGNVWHVPTQPYPESHFACFPYDLVKIPVLSTCPLYICKKCGKPRERIVQSTTLNRTATKGHGNGELSDGSFGSSVSQQIGWSDCGCRSDFEAGWVLDPFAGTFTTGEFCRDNNRNAVGIELQPSYKKMAIKRARLDEPHVTPMENIEVL